MNKIIFWFKNLLLVISILLFIYYGVVTNFVGNFSNYLIFILLLILLIQTITRLIRKNSNYNLKYNLVSILSFVIFIFIILRSLYGSNFIVDINYNNNIFPSGIKYTFGISYFMQNIIYFYIMFGGLILVNYINSWRKPKKYSLLSKICFILSILALYPFITIINYSMLLYLFIILVLIGLEIEELIRNNGKKKELIIYISFVLNLLSLILLYAEFINK